MANKRIKDLTLITAPGADHRLVLDDTNASAPVQITVDDFLQNLPVAPQSAGGNTRGSFAVDLQVSRSNAANVASGNYSVIAGGYDNKASGVMGTVGGGQNNVAGEAYVFIGGGIRNQATEVIAAVLGGQDNTASGYASAVLGGQENTASNDYALAAGYRAVANKANQFAIGSTVNSQVTVCIPLYVQTTNATATVMNTGSSGRITIADDTAWMFRCDIIGITADAANYGGYTVTGIVRRSNGTVTVHGVNTVTHAESVSGWDATAEADNTNKALAIKVTGGTGQTVRWSGNLSMAEVSFA